MAYSFCRIREDTNIMHAVAGIENIICLWLKTSCHRIRLAVCYWIIFFFFRVCETQEFCRSSCMIRACDSVLCALFTPPIWIIFQTDDYFSLSLSLSLVWLRIDITLAYQTAVMQNDLFCMQNTDNLLIKCAFFGSVFAEHENKIIE